MVRIILLLTLSTTWWPLFAGETLKPGSFKANVNGVELAYQVAGEGPPLMVLPNSWGIEKERLRALFSSLEPHFTMIYFDARGMGASSIDTPENYGIATIRKDCDGLRKHLNLEKVYLLGWSAGAMNGYFHAAEYGEHLLGAILMHGGAYTDPESAQKMTSENPDFFQRLGQKIGELMQSTAPLKAKDENIKRFLLDEWLPYICADREKGKALVGSKLEPGNYSWNHMQFMIGDLDAFDAREALPKIPCPVLVMAGAKDIISPELLKKDADAIPKGSFVSFPASGHFAMLEEPEAFLEAIRNWLK